MLDSQKLVGSGPVQLVRWLSLCAKHGRLVIESTRECQNDVQLQFRHLASAEWLFIHLSGQVYANIWNSGTDY